ncbi:MULTISPECIES: aspartate kinase [unclassified Mucilaginibacter]|uniref:aspartate kinase n=1 Tax=unclassified Mucilaginibacter TaxID=2617802 RepID=UPI002AC9154B|nr:MULTISPECIES: aspartate kinase [unclassified Mucilaginibacter]MEB0262271.1 aspartate kinase [Mucilaginibacter sp. 10I4]MEB0277105.1 aspartate kinase [Mucilaginibacter sp. 10B2]MEB0301829.1 aspartate kinase [Mucilaginibacter sp. 5C4]WPX25205.1 aspartate kinase [Mucilaginibacter sp. 5C4]
MKVLKFGGTSVGSAARMQKLLDIVNPQERQIVVLSAMSGTTNNLVEIGQAYLANDKAKAATLIATLKEKYEAVIKELLKKPETFEQGKEVIDYHFRLLCSFANDLFTPIEDKVILAQGELLSTTLYHIYLKEIGVPSVLLPALDFMKTDEDNEPIVDHITAELTPLLKKHPDVNLFITQGFICRNVFGEIDNLRRGGSDYTASLIGAGIRSEEVQIWTDIDGMHNNDPRIVSNTKPIAQLSFDEAAELAYFGAKILHPQSVFPAQKYKIPVRLLNTMDPQAAGTLITNTSEKDKIKSIAAKDGITAIKIQSSRMLLAHGFLRRVFEVFERYRTSIDMITTSEVAVSLTIDDTTYLGEITAELGAYGSVDIDVNHSIICVVGDFAAEKHGYAARVLEAIKHVPVRMISYGGSDHNMSVLVKTEDKVEVLRSLHSRLF